MIHQRTTKSKRVSVFVDGNNLFYGIYDIGWHDVLWTDLRALGTSIAHSVVGPSEVVSVKHFTARPRDVSGSILKPALWVEFTGANRVHGNVETIQGRFVPRGNGRLFEEKETDANLAAHLCIDAALNRFDVAVVVTADTDFIGTLRYLKQQMPHIRVVLGLPPKPYGIRQSRKLVEQATGLATITREMLLKCQLPEQVTDYKSGREFRKPSGRRWHHRRDEEKRSN